MNRLSGGDSILDIDLSNFTGYSNSGKIQGIVLYVGSGISTAPNPLTYTNPLPVVISSGSNIVVLSGAVQLLSGGTNAVGVLGVAGSGTQILQASGSNFVGSVLATIISGSVSLTAGGGGQASGAIQVSGIVGVSGSVNVLSGQVSVSSGLVGVLSGSIAAQVSGAVIVSGNVGVSGSVQILSGSAILGNLAPFADTLSTLSQSLNMTIANATVSLNTNGCGTFAAHIVGTWTGTILAESTVDGINWDTVALINDLAGLLSTGGITTVGVFYGGCAGSSSVRLRVSSTGTGTATVSIRTSVPSRVPSMNFTLMQGMTFGKAVGQQNSARCFPVVLASDQTLGVQVSGIVGVSGSVGAQVSGAVNVSGNVGVSGSVQILSGSNWVGIVEGIFNPVAVGPASGQPYAIQIDGSGNLKVSQVLLGRQVSGAVQVSGIVGISGSVNILSGQVSVSSGLIGVLSGSIAAQVSGAVIVSGNVGVSGSAQILSGSAWIGIPLAVFNPVAVGPASGQPFPLQIDGSGRLITTATGGGGGGQTSGIVGVSGSVNVLSGQLSISSGLVGILSGSVGAQVSGAVIISGNVGISGSAQILSGSSWIGIVEGVFSPIAAGPASGQPFAVQIDGSGNLKVSQIVLGRQVSGAVQVSGAIQVSGIVGISGSVNILSGQISVSSGLVGVLSGNVGAQVSGAVNISGNVGVSGSVQGLSGSAILGNVTIVPTNSGGLSAFRAFSGLTNTGSGINVKSGASQLMQVGFANFVSGPIYAKLFDSTAAPIVSGTAPTLMLSLPASGTPTFQSIGGGEVGLQINNGLWVNLVTAVSGITDTNMGNVSGQSGQIMMWFLFRSGF